MKVSVGVPGEPKWGKAGDDQHRRNTNSWTLINVVLYEEVAGWKSTTYQYRRCHSREGGSCLECFRVSLRKRTCTHLANVH